MAQPFRRAAQIQAPGKIDGSIGEFWVNNPWDIVSAGHNLSNHERQRFYLNQEGQAFFDVSFLSGADSDGDGRCAVAADFCNNGRLDLIVRKSGGGPIALYENQFGAGHYLKISLRGKKSNRLGIGARLVAQVEEDAAQAPQAPPARRIVREMYPVNSFRSQMPCVAHFGLGNAKRVARLTITWPSGTIQELTSLAVDRHIVAEEGTAGFEVVVPGKTVRP